MSEFGGVVAVTSIALEARIAREAGVTVLSKPSLQLGPALEAAIARGAAGVISFGIAGGLKPGLAAGDCVVASAVRTEAGVIATDSAWARSLMAAMPDAIHGQVLGSDTMLSSPEQKREAHARSGALTVDMESHIAARIAAAHRVPFAVCRVVIDAAHRTLPSAAAVGLREDGTTDLWAVLRSVMREPGQVPDLLRTALDARVAWQSLRSARERLGTGLGFPAYSAFAFDLAVA